MTDILTLIVALGGWIVAAIIAWLNYKQKSEEIFFHTLDWLSGGTQKRNLGISSIEAYWGERKYKDLSLSLLSNTAIYLLLESDQKDSAHEINNLYRIMNLLLGEAAIKGKHRFLYTSLQEAVDQARVNEGRKHGLIVPVQKLEAWEQRLDILLKQV